MVLPRLAVVCVSIAILAAGCSETARPQPDLIQRMEGRTPTVTAPAGFFGADEALLKPGNEHQAALVYVNPNARWNKYSKVQLEPVEFWASRDSQVPPSDQQALTSYFYNRLKTDLEKSNFTVVNQPGPDTMTLTVALVSVSAATPGLRSVSLLIPQIRLLNKVQSLATGSYAFVGSAKVAGKITDSQSGELLAGAVDQRTGGTSIKAADQWKWGDAENIMNFWAEKTAERLARLKRQSSAS